MIVAGLTSVLAKYDLQNISDYVEAMDDKLEILKPWMIVGGQGSFPYLFYSQLQVPR